MGMSTAEERLTQLGATEGEEQLIGHLLGDFGFRLAAGLFPDISLACIPRSTGQATKLSGILEALQAALLAATRSQKLSDIPKVSGKDEDGSSDAIVLAICTQKRLY